MVKVKHINQFENHTIFFFQKKKSHVLNFVFLALEICLEEGETVRLLYLLVLPAGNPGNSTGRNIRRDLLR